MWIKLKLKKHRTFLLATLLIFSAGYLSSALSTYYSGNQIVTSFQKNFEKQSLAQLTAANLGVQAVAQNQLDDSLDTVARLSSQGITKEALRSRDFSALLGRFKNTIAADTRFESLFLLNASGVVMVSASRTFGDNFINGSDVSFREYYKQALATKEAYVSDLFQSIKGNNVLTYAVPIINDQQAVDGVMVGSVTNSGLAHRIKLTKRLDGFAFTLADSQGNIILTQAGAAENITNIKLTEPLMRSLMAGTTGVPKTEVNYQNQKVFAQGEVVEVGSNKFYILSFYDRSKYAHDLDLIRRDYNHAAWANQARNLILFIAITYLLYWVIKKHEPIL